MSGVELELRVAWQRHLGTSAAAEQWFDEVLGAYRAEGRHYHGVRHVGWVVRHVETLASEHRVDDLAATVAAAFFHDAVYDPRRDDNEAESAAMAARAVREIGWEDTVGRHVAELVRATAGHDVDGVDRDTAVLLAADLALSLREAMSNVVRHAQASAVDLSVRVADGRVVVTVSDDGVGIQSDRRSGLENLGERARAHGGTFTVESEIGEGTTLTWDMPLPPVL